MKHVISVIAAGCLLCLPTIALSGALEDGSAALDRKDYEEAHGLLLPVAKEGDAFAQYNLGVMYAQGLGVNKNEEEAVGWYQKAAAQGYPEAQSNLALMYESGRGVKTDYKLAMEWYLKAAAQGYALAQHNIGSMYFNGYGVPKDDKKAVEWYRKAAEQGLPLGQNALGAMYAKGWGVEEDLNKGLEWMIKAAKQDLPDAKKNVFAIYYREAKQGNPGAMHNVGYMCLNGWVGSQDPNKCIKWYEKGARNGFAPSATALSEIYEQGLFGINADAEKADYWKQQAKSN